MSENRTSFSKEEPRREEEGKGRVACPICGALVNLSDVAEVSRHLNGLHSTPVNKAGF